MSDVKYYDAPTLKAWNESSVGFRIVEADNYDALAAENARLKEQLAALQLAADSSMSEANTAPSDVGATDARPWFEHGPGKPCPFVHPYLSRVDVRLRSGKEKLNDLACNYGWFWREWDPQDYDLIAYRPAQAEGAAGTDAAKAQARRVEALESELRVSANRLERLAIEFEQGSMLRWSTSQWAEEVRELLATRDCMSDADAARPEALAIMPKGMRLVPVEPTPAMMAHWREGRVINASGGSQERADAAAVRRWHDVLAVASVTTLAEQAAAHDAPYPEDVAAQLERTDWTPEEALRWYAAGKHFDTQGGRTRIIDTGAVASNALKHLSLSYLGMKGDAELSELRSHAAPQKYDDVLLPFLAMMRAELHANSGKGDRPSWLQMDVKTALLEIFYHMGKLQKAAKKGDINGVREYTADVANTAMMLADIHGVLTEYPAAPESEPDNGIEWSIVPVGRPPVELVLWNALVECRSAIGTNFRVTSREAALAAIAEAIAFQQSAQQAEPEPPARAEARVVGFKPGMSQVTLELEAGRLPSWMDMYFPVTVIAAERARDE